MCLPRAWYWAAALRYMSREYREPEYFAEIKSIRLLILSQCLTI